MNEIKIDLMLTADGSNSMDFRDTYEGLEEIWYRVVAHDDGSVDLWATADGFEQLGRMFLKYARGRKQHGYHGHFPLEFGKGPSEGPAELTIGIVDSPLPPAE